MKKRHCGSCAGFIKWKHDKYGGGLCEINDWRTKSDYGGSCRDWSSIKYQRVKSHNQNNINPEH